ncbi:MAG: hypothetical protein O2960_29825, partial [Verrucomicrobia bacterium]|nr:hypothetical protein [Verrucomicrobiota bacterium]
MTERRTALSPRTLDSADEPHGSAAFRAALAGVGIGSVGGGCRAEWHGDAGVKRVASVSVCKAKIAKISVAARPKS